MRSVGVVVVGLLGGVAALVLVVGLVPFAAPVVPADRPGRHVLVGGVKIRALQEGQGPDVLLVHGGMGSLEDWEPVRGLLAASMRVTSYDRPGHGFSERAPEGHSLATNARIAAALIATQGLRDVTVVGHSYGGGVALATAVHDPAAVRALVLVGSIGAPPVVPASRLQRILAMPVVGPGVARFLAPVVGPSMIRSIIERSFLPRPVPDDFLASRVALWNGPQHIVTWAEQRVSGPDDVAALVPRYGTLDRPVHLVHGAEDALVPIEGADRLRALLPRAELVVLGATGHYVQYVQPQELVKVVRRAARAE
jgi:pimeloyl-ACP methyl ester carboxylesterase